MTQSAFAGHAKLPTTTSQSAGKCLCRATRSCAESRHNVWSGALDLLCVCLMLRLAHTIVVCMGILLCQRPNAWSWPFMSNACAQSRHGVRSRVLSHLCGWLVPGLGHTIVVGMEILSCQRSNMRPCWPRDSLGQTRLRLEPVARSTSSQQPHG